MLRRLDLARRSLMASGAALTMLMCGGAGSNSSEKVLYSFQGGADGIDPESIIENKSGNFYGTTFQGGAGGADCQNGSNGCGTVFELAADGTEKVLHSFTGGSDGTFPLSLILEKTGDLYGTTLNGGGSTNCYEGCGTVFELASDGTETVLHAFKGGADGGYPSTLIRDKNGDLYGTTQGGGNMADCDGYGCGAVFKLKQNGKTATVYAFQGGTDGTNPDWLIIDSSGNLLGTTYSGGGADCGTVFRITPEGSESVISTFQGGSDGCNAEGLLADGSGDFYGATESGGNMADCDGFGCGTVFELGADGTKTVLHAFTGGSDGAYPGGLILDKTGGIYGFTQRGGTGTCKVYEGCGTVFKLAPDGTETVLFAFGGCKRGCLPGWLLKGRNGGFYGSAFGGTYKYGIVFSIKN